MLLTKLFWTQLTLILWRFLKISSFVFHRKKKSIIKVGNGMRVSTKQMCELLLYSSYALEFASYSHTDKETQIEANMQLFSRKKALCYNTVI